MNVWTEVKHLEGRTLKTLDQGKLFDVVKVGPRTLIVRPHARGIERTIHGEEVEGAFSELVRRGEITRSDIHERYSNFNPAYVAAMLASLPGVTVLRKPIRLYYRSVQ